MFRKLTSSFIICFAISAVQVHAEDQFAQGCVSYTSGLYGAAKLHFIAAVKANPKSWKAQYQLANTLLQLKETDNAKQAYQKCLSLKPDPEIKKHCESAIAYIVNPPKPVPVKAASIEVQNFSGSQRNGESGSTSSSSSSSSSSASSGSTSQSDAREQAIEAHRSMIISEAQRKADAIKEECKRAIEEGDANSNHRWRNRETGERFTGMNQEERNAIQVEYDRKASAVMQEAHRRAKEITSP